MLDLGTKRIFRCETASKPSKKKFKTKQIGILATESATKSKGLSKYIQKNIPKSFKIFKINGTNLVDLVESWKISYRKKYC